MAPKEDPTLSPPHPLFLNSELRSGPNCSRNYGRDSLNGGTGWKSASWNLPEIHHLGCQRKLFMGRWVIRGTLLQSYMWGRVSGGSCWPLRAAGCFAQQKLENGEAVSASLSDGRFQGEAAGHCRLGVTLHCRNQALENMWCFRTLVLEKAVYAAATCWVGPPEAGIKIIFLLAMSFQCPLLASLQDQLIKEKHLNGPEPFSQNRHKGRIWSQETKISKWYSPPLWLLSFHMHPSIRIWILLVTKQCYKIYLTRHSYPSHKRGSFTLPPNYILRVIIFIAVYVNYSSNLVTGPQIF